MLPQFPNFKKLSIEDRPLIEAISKNFPEYSEYNFSCMFVWDVSDPVYFSILNNNLILKFTDFRSRSYYYSLIGNNMVDETLESLIEHAQTEGVKPALYNVPSVVVNAIKNPDKFDIHEDKDNHDYLLSVVDLVKFRSNQYRGKKNLLNRFQRHYGDITECRLLDLGDEDAKNEIRRVLEKWESAVSKDSVDIITEFAAIEKSLKHAKELGMQCYGSYINGSLEAFTIFEQVGSKTIMIHFDKANKEFVGIFEHLKHNLAKHLHENHGVEVINYTQDLGIPGLREAKQSYHPVGYLKKYTVKLKTPELTPKAHLYTAPAHV